MAKKKKTVGEVSYEIQSKSYNSSSSVDPREIQQAQEKEYIDNLVWCVNHALKHVPCASEECAKVCEGRSAYEGDFFIVVLLKVESVLKNVIRNYFMATVTCPTPTYDQTVYKYNHQTGNIEYIWTIPDRETCLIYKENAKQVVPAEQALLSFVLDFYNGNLLRKAKKFNKETMHAGGLLEINA